MAANQARKPGTTVGGIKPSALNNTYMFCSVASDMSTELSEKNDVCVIVGSVYRYRRPTGGQLASTAVFFLYIPVCVYIYGFSLIKSKNGLREYSDSQDKIYCKNTTLPIVYILYLS